MYLSTLYGYVQLVCFSRFFIVQLQILFSIFPLYCMCYGRIRSSSVALFGFRRRCWTFVQLNIFTWWCSGLLLASTKLHLNVVCKDVHYFKTIQIRHYTIISSQPCKNSGIHSMCQLNSVCSRKGLFLSSDDRRLALIYAS